LFAQWIVALIIAGIPASIMLNLAYLRTLTMDCRALGFTFNIAALTGVLFGVGPALQSSRPDLNEVLKEGRTSGTVIRGRLRGLLVGSEIALAMMLLTSAGLM